MSTATIIAARRNILLPAFDLLPAPLHTPRAEIALLTIGLQESALLLRDQLESSGFDTAPGPAYGLWQMEKGGGIRGVLKHPASAPLATKLCRDRGVDPGDPDAVAMGIKRDDVLACALARLLLYTDAKPLPVEGDAERMWAYYLRVWRPGAVQRSYDALHRKFIANYHDVLDALDIAP